MATNAPTDRLSSTDWKSIDPLVALQKAFALVDENAEHAMGWYATNMKSRGRMARFIRFLALALFAIGGLVPIASGLLGGLPWDLQWQQLGYVALALGAGLLGFDHFFGISSAYARFVTSELAIKNAQAHFHADWLSMVAQNAPLQPGALKPFFDRMAEFMAIVVQTTERETQEWVAEFRSSLSELEQIGNRGRAPAGGVAARATLVAPAATTPQDGAAAEVGANGQRAEPPPPLKVDGASTVAPAEANPPH
jgi:hypothetical protein